LELVGVRGSTSAFTRTIDTQFRHYDLTRQPLRDGTGGEQGVLCVIHDVTASRVAEEALRTTMARLDAMVGERTAALAAERERLAVTMRSMSDGVMVLNGEGRVMLINQAASTLVRQDPDDALGKPLTALVPWLHEPGEKQPSLPDEKPHDYEMNDGSGRIVECVTSSITDGPESGGAVLMLRDVTRERASREQQEREGRLAALGQMAAGIAHDFNNFLTGVVTTADTLARIPGTPERSLRLLQQLGASGRRTALLVSEVLEFSRETVTPRRIVAVNHLLSGMEDLVRTIVPEDVALSFSVEDADYPVMANEGQLQHVVSNLLSNAADAVSSGGHIDLHLTLLKRDNGHPPLPDMGPGPWAVLSVSDDGEGIPPEAVGRIFDPFYTTKRPGKGTGLGMAQVYGVIKQHEGRVHVMSQLGVGTTVAVFLPVAEGSVSVPEERPAVEMPRGQGETVLLVEDDPLVVDSLSIALEYLGYRLLTAPNGEQGVVQFKQHRDEISVVLTDISMPGMDGVEMYRALRAIDPGVRVVAMTGYALDDAARTQLAAGIMQWLQKPPLLPELARALRSALDSSAAA
jgi:PAS domain S-box-containing protein